MTLRTITNFDVYISHTSSSEAESISVENALCTRSLPLLQALQSSFPLSPNDLNMLCAPRFNVDVEWQWRMQKSNTICFSIQRNSPSRFWSRKFGEFKCPKKLCHDSPLVALCEMNTRTHSSSCTVSILIC